MEIRKIKKGPFSMYGNPYTQNDPFGFCYSVVREHLWLGSRYASYLPPFSVGNKKRGRFACTGQYIQNDLLIFVD